MKFAPTERFGTRLGLRAEIPGESGTGANISGGKHRRHRPIIVWGNQSAICGNSIRSTISRSIIPKNGSTPM